MVSSLSFYIIKNHLKRQYVDQRFVSHRKNENFLSDVKMTSHGPPKWYEFTACLAVKTEFQEGFSSKFYTLE